MDELRKLAGQISEAECRLTTKIRFINNNLLGASAFEKTKRQVDEALRDLYRIRVELDCLRYKYNELYYQLNSTAKTA